MRHVGTDVNRTSLETRSPEREQCARLVRPGGYVVWNVADINHAGHTTHLIDDCARVLAARLALVGISRIEWDALPHDLVADALLVFRRGE